MPLTITSGEERVVFDQTSNFGTGSIPISGASALPNHQLPTAAQDGKTIGYVIENIDATGQAEVGRGIYNDVAGTITRTAVAIPLSGIGLGLSYSTSGPGTLVPFAAGATKRVALDFLGADLRELLGLLAALEAAPPAHAASHTDGTDDIQDATAGQKGVATAAQITKLDGIETLATADQSAAEIMAAVQTVDGAASGLDSDLVDGQHAAAFATTAQGTLADSAIQPGDLGTAALVDTGNAVGEVIAVASGVPDGTKFLRDDGALADPPGGGDMLATTYDPTAVAGDAFARANHTGNQLLSTISDSGDAAALDVGTAPTEVAAGDHTHTGIAPLPHAATHVTGGADKVRDATAAQDGLMTTAFAGQLGGLPDGVNTLTWAATTSWPVVTTQRATLTLTGNTTLQTSGTPVDGAAYQLLITQDGTGGHEIIFGAGFEAANIAKWHGQAGAIRPFWFICSGLTLYRMGPDRHSHLIKWADGNLQVEGDTSVSDPSPIVIDATWNGSLLRIAGSTPLTLQLPDGLPQGFRLFLEVEDTATTTLSLTGSSTNANSGPFVWGGGSFGLLQISTGQPYSAGAAWNIIRLVTGAHASTHITGGSDAIQIATAAQDGLATSTQITKLDGIAASAEVNPNVATLAEAEAAQSTSVAGWSPQRVADATKAIGRLWDPADLALAPSAWWSLRRSEKTLTGSDIDLLAGLAGGDLTGTAARQPVLVEDIGGIPAARFGVGGDEIFVNPISLLDLVGTVDYTFAFSIDITAATLDTGEAFEDDVLIADIGEFWGVFITNDPAGAKIQWHQWDGVAQVASVVVPLGKHVGVAWYDSTAQELHLRVDQLATAVTSVVGVITDTTNSIMIGSQDVLGPSPFTGDIFELVVVKEILSVVEQDAMLDYLLQTQVKSTATSGAGSESAGAFDPTAVDLTGNSRFHDAYVQSAPQTVATSGTSVVGVGAQVLWDRGGNTVTWPANAGDPKGLPPTSTWAGAALVSIISFPNYDTAGDRLLVIVAESPTGMTELADDPTPGLGGTMSGNGFAIVNYTQPHLTGVSGGLTQAAHGGRPILITGAITSVPVTNGFQCLIRNKSGGSLLLTPASGSFIHNGSTAATINLPTNRELSVSGDGTDIWAAGAIA